MKSIEYKIVKKLHLTEIHMHNGVKIDVVGYCNTVALQHVLAQLELDQRMTIVCLKALFKKLRKDVVLELLWFVPTRIKNIHGWKNPFFAQLCHCFGDFDFDKEQMTTKGRIKKRGRCAKVTIWDMFSKRWNSGAGFA